MTQKDRKNRHLCSNRASERLGTVHNNQNTHQKHSEFEAREKFTVHNKRGLKNYIEFSPSTPKYNSSETSG